MWGKHPVCQQLALPIPMTVQGWEVAPPTRCLHFSILVNNTKLLVPSSWTGGEGPGRSQQCSELC